MKLEFKNLGEGHYAVHAKQIASTTNRTKQRIKTLRKSIELIAKELDALECECDKQTEIVETVLSRSISIVDKVKDKAQLVIDDLASQINNQTVQFDSVELEAIAKARTIAIFESILFAIENWATDDVPASDFTPVAQAVLFKTVYDSVMTGVSDYYLDEIPFSAHEVVKRGREYVKALRSETELPLTDVSMGFTAQQYQQWWTNDALVLLYGDRDPDWENITPHTAEEMELWRSTDMDKTMHFPRIFDAFELTRKYGDEIRESSGLPDFTKQIMQTRLSAHE